MNPKILRQRTPHVTAMSSYGENETLRATSLAGTGPSMVRCRRRYAAHSMLRSESSFEPGNRSAGKKRSRRETVRILCN